MAQGNSAITKPSNNSMQDMALIDFFLAKKQEYSDQRLDLEDVWRQARKAFYVKKDIDRIYNGRSNINIPIMRWKLIGIIARIMRIIFNTDPIGRIEQRTASEEVKKDVIDLINKFIFEKQLDEIDFEEEYEKFWQEKGITGTAIAKITQEFESEKINFFDEPEDLVEETVIKDNTFFRPLVTEEFYTDFYKENLQESAVNIHSTVLSMEELREARKIEIKTSQEVDENGDLVIVREEFEEPLYRNLDLLTVDGNNITKEHMDYIEQISGTKKAANKLIKKLKMAKKTGFIEVDECWGKFDLNDDGVSEEIVCTIAFDSIVIRAERTPFTHKRFKRPFIAGRFKKIPGQFYGESNITVGNGLFLEYNATRSQAMDARTRAVAPMWYEDTSKTLVWDRVWRPGGVVKGSGPNGLQPLIQPNLQFVAQQDAQFIERDIDKLWSLSPVQEGTSSSANIPKTARATSEIISQNDMPLNLLIRESIENEIKPFIEMLYERDIKFKTVEDLLSVWSPKEIQNTEGVEQIDRKDLLFDVDIKILGNLELSNEISHQVGYERFGQVAQQIPPLAKRTNWIVYGEKILKSYGIKDDSEGLFFTDEELARISQQEQQQQQQQVRAQQIQMQRERQMKKQDFTDEKAIEATIDTNKKINEMEAEASIELATGQKVG